MSATSGDASQHQQAGEVFPFPVLKVQLVFASAVFVIFVAFVYIYGTYGGPWVASLEDRLGEVVARKADRFRRAGDVERAAEMYRQALNTGLEDPNQRVWISQRFGEMLIDNGRYEEGFEVAISLLDHQNLSQWGSVTLKLVSLVNSALLDKENYELMLKLGRQWHKKAVAAEHPRMISDALFWQGRAHMRLGNLEDGAAALVQAYETYPHIRRDLNAAEMLIDQGRGQDASPMLQHAMEHGSTGQQSRARALQNRINERGEV